MKKIIFLFFFIFNITNAFGNNKDYKNELKLGILKHDLAWFGGGKKEKGIDINLEYIKKTRYKLTPYIHIGGTYNTGGNTDLLYSGISYRLIKNHYYGGIDLGLVYHTNKKDKCSILLREALYIGYEIKSKYRLELFLDHMSDAWACEPNDSMETGGIRFGIAF